MYHPRTLLALVLLSRALPLAHAAAQSAASTMPELPRSSRIKIGDAVRVTVWRNPDLSGQIDLAEDGTLIHPLYRSVRAAGLTIPELEGEIRTVLLRYENAPQFVVEPLLRVVVGGEVRAPSMVMLPPSATVLEAVARAGGFTRQDRANRVRLLRDGQTEYVDLTRPYVELEEMRIRSGDQIIVDRRRRLWRDDVQPVLTTAGSMASLAIVFLRVARYW
jgi:polysaccharide biosynthesis/export protein